MSADRMVAAVTIPPVGPDSLETLLRHLLPTTPVPTLPPSRYPRNWRVCCSVYCRECRHRRPLHHLRPGLRHWKHCCSACFRGRRSRGRDRVLRDWATIVCFSCGKSGHGVGRCPELNETFQYMMISPGLQRNVTEREMATDPGRGSAPHISYEPRPQDPGGGDV